MKDFVAVGSLLPSKNGRITEPELNYSKSVSFNFQGNIIQLIPVWSLWVIFTVRKKHCKKKMKFSLEDVFSKWEQKQSPRDVPRKGVLKICSKFTGEDPCGSAVPVKLLCKFIEITLLHGCSPVNLLHIFRTAFLKAWFPPRRWAPLPTFVAGDKFGGNYHRWWLGRSISKSFDIQRPSSSPNQMSFLLCQKRRKD